MRRLISLLALAFGIAGSALAQTANSPYTAPEYFASSFNLWSLQSNFGSGPNSFVWPGGITCNANAQGISFFEFATTQPVLISDANTANSEVVTPSAVTRTAGQCGFSASPSNTHLSYRVSSGTAGLQEAINQLKDQSAWPVLVILDRNWYSIANQIPGTSAATIIGATTGDATVLLEDITTSPATFYKYNGTTFSSTTSTWINTAGTLAAGAAAGTSPTIAYKAGATALIGTVNLTEGSAPTTGTLFTITYPATSGGGFGYTTTGACTVTSVGTNSFTAFTVASAGGTTRVLTVTATSAPTAATAYAFTYNCK